MLPLLCDLGVHGLGDKELVVSFDKILKQADLLGTPILRMSV
jgi:hypothetical protein